MTKKISRKKYHVIVWFLILIGFTLQVYYVSEQYFKFDTVTSISFNYADNVSLPKFVHCFAANEYETIKEAKVDLQQSPHQLHQMVIVVDTCKENSYIVNVTIVEEKFLRDHRICYSIDIELEQFDIRCLASNSVVAYLYLNQTLLEQVLNHSSSTVMSLYMQPKNLVFRRPMYKSLSLNTAKKGSDVSYTYHREELLSWPYATDCVNYQGYESQDHCLIECKREFLQKLDMFPIDLVIFNHSYFESDDIKVFPKFAQETALKSVQCPEKCRFRDCVREEYSPTLSPSSGLVDLVGDIEEADSRFGLLITVPFQPQMVTRSKPKITLIDYLTYIASCLNFWLAFSPLVLMTNEFILNKWTM